MTEKPDQYQAEFVGKAQGVAVGEGNTIYNYFYYHEVKPVDPEADDDADLPCPYRGLFHFGPNDAEFFFGRDIFVAELYSATQTRSFIPVLGASGSGKSSVVLAGLVPKLQQEGHWQFTHFRPGADPFHALALALVPLYATTLNETERIAQSRQLATYLRQGNIPLGDVFAQIQQNFPQDRILLIADQFEELYTLCPEAETRHRFLDHLIAEFQSSTAKPGKAVLVLTMRADFLGNALSYPAFADQLRSVDIKIRSMNREELAEVIEKPAAKLGVTFEGGLVERILNDVADQPGNLPLLEFALTELWHQRTGKQLTHEVYEAIGQVEGALSRHADQKYEHLSEAERTQVRRIFVQLVRPGEGAEDTRRIAMKSEIGEQSWSLVKQLADARLVVTSRNATEQETVEVVHEALIRNWGELRGWMETDRVFRAWQERLRAAKQQWEMTNRDAGSLLRGAALAEAEERLAERPDDLVAERELIEQSIHERERLEREKVTRRHREIRTLWGIAFGSLIALAISTGLFLTARYQQKQAELSEADSLARYSLTLLAEGKDLDAYLVAIQAGRIIQQRQAADPEVMSALIATIYKGRGRNQLEGHNVTINSVSFSPDNKTLATGSGDKTAKLWNIETGEEILTLAGHDGWIWSTSFSPDGKTLATGSSDKTAKLWNVETGEEILTLAGHDGRIWSTSFSPDGKTLATGSSDKTAKLWNVETGEEILTLAGHDGWINGVSYSPNGQTLVTISDDKTVRLWNVEDGEEIDIFFGHEDSVLSVSFSPNGQTLATSSLDQTVKLWSLGTGKEILSLSGHDAPVLSVSFSPDGKTLATSSRDQTVKLWNLDTGEEILNLADHDDWVNSVSFSPDGKTLASGSGDRTVKLWNVETESILTLSGHSDWVNSVEFSLDSRIIATSSNDRMVKLWNVETGEKILTLAGHDGWVNSVSFGPDGQTLASGSGDQTVKLWNLETGEEILTLVDPNEGISSIDFSPNGHLLASGGIDKTVKIWNIKTGKEVLTLSGHNDTVHGTSFSPDGRLLATSSRDKTVKLWDVETGEEILTLAGHDDWVDSVSFSPDGQTLATASDDQTVKLWNIETGEEVVTLTGHDSFVISVSFSPDGQILASGSGDRTVKFWNVKTGEEIATLVGHDEGILSTSFSPNGQTLATSSQDQTAKLWRLEDLNLDSLIEHNCNRIRNYLKYNPNVSEEDRQLCNNIGTEQKRQFWIFDW